MTSDYENLAFEKDNEIIDKKQPEITENDWFFLDMFLTLMQSIYKDPYDLLKVVD